MQRLSVLYCRVPDLLLDLAEVRGTPRHARLLRRLERLDLICLDDWGLKGFSFEDRRDILELAERRYQRKSILIGSQLPANLWHDMIGEGTIADAILDRIVHNAYSIELTGNSMRREVRLPPLPGATATPDGRNPRPARHSPGASGAQNRRDYGEPRVGKQA